MIPKNLKSINNISRRFRDYDSAGTKYAFDIHFTTAYSSGECLKAKRQQGADVFDRHIKELSENYDGVATITVSDYCGKAGNALRINSPVTIDLTDTPAEGQTSYPSGCNENNSGREKPVRDVLQGLSGLFAGTEYADFGSFAPIAKFIDDRHVIKQLHEKNDALSARLMESERKNTELSATYQSLSVDYERLQAEADEMDEELECCRRKEEKRAGMMTMIGLAGASIAKTFLRQNPSILSGIIPAEQLSGILSEDADTDTPVPVNDLSEEDRERSDKAASVFEWLQALEKPLFDEVYSIISLIRRQPEYAAHITGILSGKSK